MPIEMMLIVILVAVIAGALGYFVSHSRNASALAAQRQQAADTERQLQASKSELQQQAEALRAATASLQFRETELAVALQQVESTTQRGEQINQECSLLKTRLDEEQRAFPRRSRHSRPRRRNCKPRKRVNPSEFSRWSRWNRKYGMSASGSRP